jgi:hypothetical protein
MMVGWHALHPPMRCQDSPLGQKGGVACGLQANAALATVLLSGETALAVSGLVVDHSQL